METIHLIQNLGNNTVYMFIKVKQGINVNINNYLSSNTAQCECHQNNNSMSGLFLYKCRT